MKPILVTGATGNIGKHVVSKLRILDQPIRLASRTNESSQGNVFLDLQSPKTFDSALDGCKAVFLLRPPAVSNTKKTLNVFVDRAYQVGVQHIVFVSVSGAEDNSIVPHHAVEQRLIRSGGSFTILRPGFFSQNIETAYRSSIVLHSRLYLPCGDGLINFIDTRDIAEIAVKSLVAPERHNGEAYTLVGREAVTFSEVARILSNALNRSIEYKSASIIGYLADLLKGGTPVKKAIVQAILHRGIRSGSANIVDNTAERLLGREPIRIKDYIDEHSHIWQAESGST